MTNQLTLDIRIQGDQLLDLTRDMLAAAESDDWEEFELLEQKRAALLSGLFSNPADAESAKLHLVDVAKEMLAIDEVISNLIRQQRDLAAEELRHLRKTRDGNKAYQVAVDDSL
jgi:hypothetical protein